MKEKRLSCRSEELLIKLIQKQLDLHGAKFEDIKATKDGKLPNGEFWYQHYTFETKEQYEDWKEFCITELRNSRERLSKNRAEEAFRWIDLQWGLKHQFEHDNLV
jgi:hypothetical protein